MAHVLLVVVLALGVFVMHTVGHPDGAAGSGTHTMAGQTSVTDQTAMTGHTAMADRTPGADGPSAHSAAPAAAHPGTSGASADDASHYAPGPGTGMNMASLCMAVLGTWALAALLQAALARRPGWAADLLAKTVALLRPNPPPRGPDLTQLSVLRI